MIPREDELILILGVTALPPQQGGKATTAKMYFGGRRSTKTMINGLKKRTSHPHTHAGENSWHGLFIDIVQKVESGQFALLKSGETPIAQLFIPYRPPIPKQFSFFWRGHAPREQIHELFAALSHDGSEVSIRLIAQSVVASLSFSLSRTERESPALEPNIRLTHQLIKEAELPYSFALTVTGPKSACTPAQVYVWATVSEGETGEIGTRIALSEWEKPAFAKAVFPLFERTIGIPGDDARDLWSQAATAAAGLMPAEATVA